MIVATWIALSLYCSLTLFFVIRGSKKTGDIKDYALGNINFSPSFVGLSLAASMTSAATFIINPGLIGKYGISGFISYGLVLPIAAILSLILLTKGFRKFGSGAMSLGLAQWIGKRYDSKAYGFSFAVLSLLLITFIVLICVGITQVLSRALEVEAPYVLAGVIVFIFGYMMFGGANSMVYTNAMQALLMLVVAILLLGSGYHYFADGIEGFLSKLKTVDPSLVEVTNPQSFLFRDFFEIYFTQAIVGIAIVCQPHIITKSLLLKEEKDVNRYLTVGSLVQFLFFLVVLSGLYARLTFPDMMYKGTSINPDGLISTYVVASFPVYVSILMVMGLISAGVSTLEGLIQSLSTTITSDIIKPLSGIGDSKKLILINKTVIILLGFIAFLLSYQQLIKPNLSVAMFAQNGVYAFFSAAFVPVLFGMFIKNVPKAVPMIASATALFVHFLVYYAGLTTYMQAPVKNPAVPSSLAIVSSVAVAFIFLLVLRKKQGVHD